MEQRINALEEEFKVLKSQIKAVLLDIKEYLATGNGTASPHPMGAGGSGEHHPADTQTGIGPITVSSYGGSGPGPGGFVGPHPGVQGGYGGQPADMTGHTAEPMHTQAHASKTGLLEAEARDEGHWERSEPVLCPLKKRPAETGTDEVDTSVVDIGNENQVVDLLTVSVLSQWLSRAITIVGKSQITKLVEIYEITGNMPSRLKDTLLLLADLYGGDNQSEDTAIDSVPATVSIQLLIELDSLLQYRKNTLESVIFSMLLNKGEQNKKGRHG